jgi:hypothetical protein
MHPMTPLQIFSHPYFRDLHIHSLRFFISEESTSIVTILIQMKHHGRALYTTKKRFLEFINSYNKDTILFPLCLQVHESFIRFDHVLTFSKIDPTERHFFSSYLALLHKSQSKSISFASLENNSKIKINRVMPREKHSKNIFLEFRCQNLSHYDTSQYLYWWQDKNIFSSLQIQSVHFLHDIDANIHWCKFSFKTKTNCSKICKDIEIHNSWMQHLDNGDMLKIHISNLFCGCKFVRSSHQWQRSFHWFPNIGFISNLSKTSSVHFAQMIVQECRPTLSLSNSYNHIWTMLFKFQVLQQKTINNTQTQDSSFHITLFSTPSTSGKSDTSEYFSLSKWIKSFHHPNIESYFQKQGTTSSSATFIWTPFDIERYSFLHHLLTV